MRTIVTPRGGGKTTKLIKLSVQKGEVIVTKDRRTLEYTVQMAHEMELEILRPITFDEFLDRRWRGQIIKGFLIDDAEMLLLHMLDRVTGALPINAMTFSSDRGYQFGHPDSEFIGSTVYASETDL